MPLHQALDSHTILRYAAAHAATEVFIAISELLPDAI